MRRIFYGAVALVFACGLLSLPACGDDDSGCLTGETDCDGVCVDLMTDPDYCGDCDTICSLGDSCVAGTCTQSCGMGEDLCDGMCVDLNNDPDYCGDCDTVCGLDEYCDMGVCTGCGAGYDLCDDVCVDLQTDNDYCGDCLTMCGANEECVAGVCGMACGDMVYSDEPLCQDCMTSNCCTEMAACTSGTDCGTLFDCMDACGADEPCQQNCISNNPNGTSAAQALVSCADACTDECAAAGICDTELSYPSAALTQCVTDNCCATYDPCYADTDCNACMQDTTLAGCDTNALYGDYQACLEASCPTNICGTDIGWYDENQDPIFDCNACLSTSCCADLTTCVGDESQPAVDLCIECLNGGPNCTDTTIEDAANAFMQCQADNCPTDCQ